MIHELSGNGIGFVIGFIVAIPCYKYYLRRLADAQRRIHRIQKGK
jgi:biopolymer transport protein ExbB/TolQ